MNEGLNYCFLYGKGWLDEEEIKQSVRVIFCKCRNLTVFNNRDIQQDNFIVTFKLDGII